MNRRRANLAGALTEFTILLAAVVASAADWPRLGGPDGAYVSTETRLARNWPTNGPRVLWNVDVGKGFAGAAVSGGQVFMLDRPDDLRDVLRCLDLANGREEWRWTGEAPGALPYNGSRNVPTVDERFVFTVGPLGHFSCLDRRTHQAAWTKHLVDDFKDPEIDRAAAPTNRADQLARAQLPRWGLTQAPLLYGDTIIVAPQTRKVGLVAYDKATGKIRWRSGYVGRNWYSHISPQLCKLGGVDQVILLAQPSDPEKAPAQAPPAIISATDPITGKILWTTKTPGPHKIPIAQPLQVGDDRLFISGGYGLGCLLLRVFISGGQWTTEVLLHNKTVAAHIHSPILYRDHIFVSSLREQGGAHSGLVCLSREAQVRWQTGPPLQLYDGGLLIVNGLALAMNGKNGRLHLIDLSGESPKILAAADVLDAPQVWAPMALSDGKLLVRDHAQLKCLDLRNP